MGVESSNILRIRIMNCLLGDPALFYHENRC
jgi:hypothetical protein